MSIENVEKFIDAVEKLLETHEEASSEKDT